MRIGRSFVVIRERGRPKERPEWLNAPDTMSVMENPGPLRDNTNLLAPINIPFGRGTGCRFGEPRPSHSSLPSPPWPSRSFRRASASTLISLEFITHRQSKARLIILRVVFFREQVVLLLLLLLLFIWLTRNEGNTHTHTHGRAYDRTR